MADESSILSHVADYATIIGSTLVAVFGGLFSYHKRLRSEMADRPTKADMQGRLVELIEPLSVRVNETHRRISNIESDVTLILEHLLNDVKVRRTPHKNGSSD